MSREPLRLATVDTLTELPNRRAFFDRAGAVMLRREVYSRRSRC